MTEFGHAFGAAPGLHIDSWGAGPFVITVGNTTYRFEDSDRFGPHLVDESDEYLDKDVPSARSSFWPAHSKWIRGGRRLDGNICLFDPILPGVYRRGPRGRRIVVAENDADIGAGWMEEV